MGRGVAMLAGHEFSTDATVLELQGHQGPFLRFCLDVSTEMAMSVGFSLTLCINGVPQLSWMVDTKKSHLEVDDDCGYPYDSPFIIPSHPTSLTRPQPWFQRPLLFQRLEKGHGCEGLEGLKLFEDLSSLSLVMTSEWEWIKANVFF